MSNNYFDVKLTIECYKCNQGFKTSDVNILLGLVFKTDFPEFECPNCHQKIDIAKCKNVDKTRKIFLPMCLEIFDWIESEMKKPGILDEIKKEAEK